jgi:hypothetical protein
MTGNRLWALRIIPRIMLSADGAVQPQAWGDDECGLPHVGVGLVNNHCRRAQEDLAARLPVTHLDEPVVLR